MRTRDFKIGHDIFVHGEKDPEAGIALKNDCRQFLFTNGVDFSDGAEAILNDTATRLTVHNTPENLEYIDHLLAAPPSARELPVPGPKVPKVRPSPDDLLIEQMRKRLRSILLPTVAFENIGLLDAIDQLKAMGIRCDTKNASRPGVEMILAGKVWTPSDGPRIPKRNPQELQESLAWMVFRSPHR